MCIGCNEGVARLNTDKFRGVTQHIRDSHRKSERQLRVRTSSGKKRFSFLCGRGRPRSCTTTQYLPQGFSRFIDIVADSSYFSRSLSEHRLSKGRLYKLARFVHVRRSREQFLLHNHPGPWVGDDDKFTDPGLIDTLGKGDSHYLPDRAAPLFSSPPFFLSSKCPICLE